ncbi:MAG: hypothetical protein RI897_590 [Verrucomicrobiota bacterium]
MSAASGFAEAGEGVGGFAGLADDEDERSGFDGGIAVAEFAGVFDFDRDVGEVFDHVFAGEGGVPAGTTGINEDAIHGAELGGGHVEAAEVGRGFLLVEAAAERIFEGAWLLKDLLEHVVSVRSLLGFLGLEIELADAVSGCSGVSALDLEPVGMDCDDVMIVEIDHLLGVGDNCGCIAGEEIFPLADTDDEGGASSGSDDDVGMVVAEDGDAVGAHDIGEGVHHGLGEWVGFRVLKGMAVGAVGAHFFVMDADEVGEDLGIGCAVERMPLGCELFPQRLEVFDNAVVYERDAA